jgi:RHS repeat-associated protein
VTNGSARQSISHNKAGAIGVSESEAGAVTKLDYNQAGRLASVTAGSDPLAQYTYDAFGRRLIKAGAATGTTLFQYGASGSLLEEAGRDGVALVDYIYLDDAPVATLSPASGEVNFLHGDRLGTPRIATDSGQNTVWTASYGPFGEMSATPGLIVQNLRLPGQEFDADTGLYHNGFRDYSPGWGRYIQSDPIGLMGGLNTYGYAGANPVRSIDRLGLQYYPIPYDPSYYDAAFHAAIFCSQYPQQCHAQEEEQAKLYAEQLDNVSTLLDILAGLSLLDPLTAPAEPFLKVGSGCLKMRSQLVYPDPAGVAGDLAGTAVTAGAKEPTQAIWQFLLKLAFTPSPAY